jgi:hypothetical protein
VLLGWLFTRAEVPDELRRLNRMLLFSFLDLLEVLVHTPKDFQRKVDEIELILVNMHHLLNYYRPHQARANLATLLEEQIQARRAAIAQIDSALAQTGTVLVGELAKLQRLLSSSSTAAAASVSPTTLAAPSIVASPAAIAARGTSFLSSQSAAGTSVTAAPATSAAVSSFTSPSSSSAVSSAPPLPSTTTTTTTTAAPPLPASAASAAPAADSAEAFAVMVSDVRDLLRRAMSNSQ